MAKAGKNDFETFARHKPELTVLTDHPLTVAQTRAFFDLDPFNFRFKLGPVFDILRHPKAKTPMAILISGGWGTGKTSAMKWLHALVEEWNKEKPDDVPDEDYICVRSVWFYPWKYNTREDVWRGLVAEVIANSIDIKNFTLKRLQYAVICVIRLLLKITALVVDSAKVKLQSPDSILSVEIGPGMLKKVLTEYRKAAHPEEAYRNKFEKALSLWIRHTMGKKERMVIFIDDLDRCMPDIALQVLEALKLYLNIENLIFVLGVDKQVIEKLVIEYYKKLGLVKKKEDNESEQEKYEREKAETKAKQYLSKMFQVEIELSPSEKQISDFFDEQLKEIPYWKKSLPDENHQQLFRGLVLKMAGRNPREVKRILNSAFMAGAGTEMIKVNEERQRPTFEQGLQDFFIRKILQKFYPSIASMIDTDNGRSFLNEWSQSLIELKDSNPEELKKVLPDYLSGSYGKKSDRGEKSKIREELSQHFLQNPQYKDYIRLLSDEDLWALMLIPFSTDLAQFTQRVRQPMEPLVGLKERTVFQADKIIINEMIGRELNKAPYELTKADYENITELDLSFSKVANIDILATLINLQSLDLSNTKVSDLMPIRGLTNLQELSFYDTQVNDLSPVKNLTNLQILMFDNTPVSNLEPIKDLTNLQELWIRDCKNISDKQVEDLKKSLPKLKIER